MTYFGKDHFNKCVTYVEMKSVEGFGDFFCFHGYPCWQLNDPVLPKLTGYFDMFHGSPASNLFLGKVREES